MPEPDAKQFAESMAEIMKGFIEAGREAMPVCFCHMKDGRNVTIGMPFESNRSKDIAGRMMQWMKENPDIEYIVFLMDVWMAQLKKGEATERAVEEMAVHGIRNFPGRQEAILAMLFGRNVITEMGHWKYSRVNQKAEFAEKMEWMAPDHCEGRLVPQEMEYPKQ